MDVKKKYALRMSPELRLKVGAAMVDARKRLNLKQEEVASAVGVRQSSLSRWERGIDLPPREALLVFADLVPELEKSYWQELAGENATPITPREAREIPVLHDAAAAGTPRAIDEHEIDYRLSVPPHLLPIGGKLSGLKVSGDSMSPILEDGYIAIVDIMSRDAKKVAGRMVAARSGDGVTIKWLRQQGKHFLLVPQNTSPRHPVHIMTKEDDDAIVGEVVLWIGLPPLPRK